MKQLNIVNYTKKNGQRTTCTLSELQLKIIDSFAKKNHCSRDAFLGTILADMEEGKNASAFIRDYIIDELLAMLEQKGVFLWEKEND